MNLFGNKSAKTPIVEDADEAEFKEGAAPLSAPSRPQAKAGGSRKSLLVLLLLLLAGGLGGAYFFMTTEEQATASLPYVAPVDQAAALPAPTPPSDAAAPAALPAPVVAEAVVSPVAPEDPLAAPPATVPPAAIAPAPLAPGEDLPMPTPSAEQIISAPPAEENISALPAEKTPSAPSTESAPASAQEKVSTGAETPAPVAAPATAAAAKPGNEQPASDQPSEAELAILNNAAPALPLPENPAGDIAAEQALIRPLPQQYFVLQQDQSASDIEARLTSARLALSQGRAEASLQIFTELREQYPKDKRVLMGRAVALQKLGQTGAALEGYKEVLEQEPKNLEALTNMLGLLKKENPSLAVEKLLELREAYPFNADVNAQLGIAYGGAGEFEEAVKYLDMADALKPGSIFVLYNRGVLFDKMGRSAEAASIYRQIVRLAADGYLDQNLPLEVIKRRLAVMR